MNTPDVGKKNKNHCEQNFKAEAINRCNGIKRKLDEAT